MLTIRDLHCTVGSKTLLDIDQLQLQQGELLGLLGANGAGKSTLLKVLAGDMPARGEILLHRRPLSQWPAQQRARQLAVLPQSSSLNFPFSAREVVALGATPLSLSAADCEREIDRLMTMTDCLSLAAQPYPSLSGGQSQRVQLARVLLQLSQAEQPPLLLLDEPTSAQDLGQQHSILQLLQQLCRQHGYTIIAILHDLNQVLRYCDRACLLADGKLIDTAAPAQLLDSDTVERHWQYRPEKIQAANGRTLLI